MSSATIIPVVQSKGGAGKTSIAIMLATTAVEMGMKVLFCDGDQNEDSTAYLSQIELDNIIIERITEDNIDEVLTKYENDVDVIIADTAGGRSGLSQTMSIIGDLKIIPVMRAKKDVQNAMNTVKDIYSLRRQNPNIVNTFRILWSNIPARSPNKAEEGYMSQLREKGYPCFKSKFRNRPVLEILEDRKINPYRFVEAPLDYAERLVYDSEIHVSEDDYKLLKPLSMEFKNIRARYDADDLDDTDEQRYSEILAEYQAIVSNGLNEDEDAVLHPVTLKQLRERARNDAEKAEVLIANVKEIYKEVVTTAIEITNNK